jgi:quercetin dioxygenase-like cupin family protein
MQTESCKKALVNFVKKEWGHEEWIVNNDKYCGKKLVFTAGYHFSMHCHKIKDETFYVLSGKFYLETEYNEIKENHFLQPGDIVHIKPNMYHRLTALVDGEIIEFSTHHLDEDSYRISSSGKIDLHTFNLNYSMQLKSAS